MARSSLLQKSIGGADGRTEGRKSETGGHSGCHSSGEPHPITLTCTKCRARKDPSEFSPSPRHKNGRFPWCKPCKAAYQVDRIRSVPKEVRALQYVAWRAQRDGDKEARAKFLRQSSVYALKRKYGLTEHNLVELATHQNGVCGICGRTPDMSNKRGSLHVDHNHKTGTVRGLLCGACNSGLGFFKDSVSCLLAAIKYVQSPPATQLKFTETISRPSYKGGVRNPEKQATLEIICKQCGKSFPRKAQAEYASRAKGKEGPFCGRTCSGIWGKKQQKVVGLIHGTTNGYTGYKCRCQECKKAHAAAEAARKLKGRPIV